MSTPAATLPSDAVVLVTGGNGFVGARTCARLAGAGVAVRATVRSAEKDPGLDGVTAVVADLDDPASLRTALTGVTHVVHTAAAAGPDLAAVADVNIAGTRALLVAARAAGVERVVHVSTTSVVADDAPTVDEDAPLVDDEASPYAVTKRDAEHVVAKAHADGLATVVLRPPAVLGWGPSSTWGQRVPTWVAEGRMPIERDPREHMGWVHVDDLTAAIELALVHGDAVGRTYVVASGTTTWGAYIDEVRSWFDDAPDPTVTGDEPPTPRTWDAMPIRRELGWAPSRSFEAGMAEAAQHHR